jgi:uncharacterized protein (TIGR02147 family)
MTNKKYYVTKLNTEFKKRASKNPSYSIRSFARDLSIDSSSLSSIMSGKRKIPRSKIEYIACQTCITESELKSFLNSAGQDHISLKNIKSKDFFEVRHEVSEHDFANISDIKTYTLLSMLELDDFKYDKVWIAKKLKLDFSSLENKISNLLTVGLVEEINGRLVRTKKRTTTSDDVVSKYIAKHHLDTLDLAKEKCVELLPSERYFSTITIPCDPDSITQVKKLIMEFEDKIEAYLRPDKKKDVFKLSIQFYQATEKD